MSDMKLPEGKSCINCIHWLRCKGLIFTLEPESTSCDWSPSRFKESPEPEDKP